MEWIFKKTDHSNWDRLSSHSSMRLHHKIAHGHSKADKIVNNFHGQNRFHFHDQPLIFIIKTPIFVVKIFFWCWDLTNFFLVKKKFLVSPILSWGQDFYFQPHSKIYDHSTFHSFMINPPFHSIGKISLSNPFHSNDKISWSASFHSNGVSDLFQSAFQSSNSTGQYIMWLYAFMRCCPNNRVYKNVV